MNFDEDQGRSTQYLRELSRECPGRVRLSGQSDAATEQGLKNLEGFDRREPAEQDQKLRQIETTLFFSLLRQNSIDGAKLILLVPPTPSSEDAVRQITIASQKAYVETLVPIDPTALPARYYLSDKLHLNSEGAALFTTALAEFLPQTIVGESLISPD